MTTLVLGAAAAAAAVTAAADMAMPAAPSGYFYREHHAIGDSGRNLKSNMDPPDQIVTDLPPCKPSPGAKDCLDVAHAACEAKPECWAFALLNIGSEEDPAKVSGKR